MNIYTEVAENYQIRTETLEEREYLVVPVIMMVEGVHAGSGGPILHLTEDLGKFPESWNGIPVTIMHPEEDGQNVSANSPEILEQYDIGKVFNTHMDGDQLKAEVWIDVLRCTAISPLALSYIKDKRALEVSVGVFTDREEVTGLHNNEEYQSIARNHRPDHLALLPGGTGACSWNDGCGIRTNQLITLKMEKNGKLNEEQILALKDLIREGFSVSLVNNEQGLLELSGKIQTKLDSMDNDQAIYFLEEMYDDYLVYRRRARESGESTLHQQNFSVNEDDTVEFTGEPIQVRRDVNYVQANKKVVRTKFNNNKKEKTMAKDDKPCCEDRVDVLIANTKTPWTDADKEWLLTQDAVTLGKLEPKVEAKKEEPVNMENYVAKKDLQTNDGFLAHASPEFKEQFEHGKKLLANHKEELITRILANAEKDSWTKEELAKEPIEMLEKLSKSYKIPVDYSGQGSGNFKDQIDTNEVEPMMPIPIEKEKEDK